MNPYINDNAKDDGGNSDMESEEEWAPDEQKPRSGNGKGKGKAGDGTGDGKEKKGIARVNRACNNCRRMKMRCVGAEDPPCKRCRSSGLNCVMEKPIRGSISGAGGSSGGMGEAGGDDRIRSLENQVSSMQNTLVDLVKTLQAGMSNNTGPGSHHSSQMDTMYPPASIGNMGFMASGSPGQSDPQYQRHSSAGSGPTPPFYNMPGNPSFVAQSPSNSAGSFHQPSTGGLHWGASGNGQYGNINIDPALLSAGGPSDTPRRPAPPAPSHSVSWPQPPAKHNMHMSLPPSRGGSVTPDDILAAEEIINPLGNMTNMAGLVEAAVHRARNERDSLGGAEGPQPEEGPPGKRRRQSPIVPHGPIILEAQNLPAQSTKEKTKKPSKKRHMHAYPDAVEEGFVTEQEGRDLMAIFYAGSSNFIPCFDPGQDTWDALRARSPFSITAIIMVGARVRDGGGPISDVQRLCREHAQRIAVGTLFNPVARIEAVQAMIMLAAFSENGWLPGGHAVRMAIDMGLNRSFLSLLQSGMGKGKNPAELEEERHLVVQSRIWFCLYLIEHQMAYGMGRPAILREDETIHQCRRLLEHPLSITSDARLVSTVELMALRAPLHIELTAAPDLPIAESTMRRLKQANSDFDAWERYWDRVLGDRFGKGRGDFFRESLIIQRQYAELFVNSQLLRGIKEPTDVVNMPEEKRALAIRAMRNAQRCIEICLRGENYRNGLRYAVHYTHVCAAFAASFLIRIARLFPHELNLKKTAKDVDELANVLSEVPAGRYARSLRLILRRARRAKVIPAASRAPSPGKTLLALPGATPGSIGNPSELPFSPSQLINPNFFTSPGGAGPSNPSGSAISPAAAALLQQAGQMINASPDSGTDMFEFDQLFAEETMERAGLGGSDQLPLFLDGHSLGGQNSGEMMPFMGMEQFFLPAVVDNRLAGPGVLDQNGSALAGLDPSLLGEDVWW